MGKKLITALAAVAGIVPTVWATDVNVNCVAGGCDSSNIVVSPGCEISYRVVVELSDAANQGLAAIFFDLEFDGGSMTPATAPTAPPMASFAPPAGFSNPSGYGGTPSAGRLLQIGGAQNVIMHGAWNCLSNIDCPAPSTCNGNLCTAIPGLPMGTVEPGVARPGYPVVAVTGVLTAPATPGSYTLRIMNVVADVLEPGAGNRTYWPVKPAGTGTVTHLSVTVQDGAQCCAAGGQTACCLPSGSCTLADPVDCVAQSGTPLGAGSACEGDLDGDGVDAQCGDQCPGEDDRIDDDGNGIPDCLDPTAIPVVSTWGLVILALSLLVGSKLLSRRLRVPIA